MNRLLLDTDTFACILQDRYPEVTTLASHYIREFRYFTVSVITVSEIVECLETIQSEEAVVNFLRRSEGLEILPIGKKESVLAGTILAQLNRIGLRLGVMDPFVAATAIENGMQLITNSPRNYQRIIDLGFPLEIGTWHRN